MAGSPPTALISWAHAADDGVGADRWRNEVLQLAVNLRHFGVDADLDLFHLSEAGVDWNKWGPRRIQTSDYTLVAVNHAWAERFEGTNLPTVGAGAAAEADTLLGLFSRDQQDFKRRVLVIVLPTASPADVPAQLSGLQRFQPKDFSLAALTPLLRLIHHLPEAVPPTVGPPPDLTQRQFDRIDEEFGTPGVHALVPGVPAAGMQVVQQQIASNARGHAVRGLLERLVKWPNFEVYGRRRKSGAEDFSNYLRLVVGAKTIGYLYPSSGLLNPKVEQAKLSSALALASTAHQIKASNPSYQVSINIIDERSRDEALELLRRAADSL